MRVDGNDLVAGAHPADDVAELVKLNFIVAELLELFGNALDNALFFAGLGRNGDHIAQELGHVGLVAFSCLLDCFIVHNTGKPPVISIICIFLLTKEAKSAPYAIHHTTRKTIVKQNFCPPKNFLICTIFATFSVEVSQKTSVANGAALCYHIN